MEERGKTLQGVVGFIVIEGDRPGPVGLKRVFFRILEFQNKLTPIRGNCKIRKTQKAAQKRVCFCNKINMDPGDDFEVLKPFSSFSGEI